MDALRQAGSALFAFLAAIDRLLMIAIVTTDAWLRILLTQLHVPENTQTTVLIILAVLVFTTFLRMIGTLIRSAVLLVALLIALHFALPIISN
jgi:hypothetical protein